MRKTLILTALFLLAGVAHAAPTVIYQRTILPEVTNTYDLGSLTSVWNKLFANYASTTALSVSGLTSGNCVQVGTGGLLTTIGVPCPTSGVSGDISTSSSETATYVPFYTSTNGTPALLSGGSANLTFNNTASRLSTAYASTTAISTGSINITSIAGKALAANASGLIYGVATTTATIGSGLSYSGTWGQLLSGVAGTLSVSGVTPGSIALPKGNFLVGNDVGVAQATSTIFITSTGQVGIGTQTPIDVNANAKLTVAGISSQDIIASTTDNTTLSDAILQAYACGSRVFMGAHGSNQVAVRYGLTLGGWSEIGAFNSPCLGLPTNGLVIGTNPAVPLVFGTNNLERARITAGGSLGVGLTNPGAELEIKGTTTDATAIALDVWNSGGVNLLRVRNDGNVGIGTTSPYALLSVSTTTTTGPYAIISGQQPLFQIGSSSPTYGYLPQDRLNIIDKRNDYSVANLYNLSTGICATADWAVANDLNATALNFGDFGHTSSLFTGSGCTNNPFTGFGANSTYLFDPSGDINLAAASATAKLKTFVGGYAAGNIITTVTATGLGIGTTTPAAKLHVAAAGNSKNHIILEDTTAGANMHYQALQSTNGVLNINSLNDLLATTTEATFATSTLAQILVGTSTSPFNHDVNGTVALEPIAAPSTGLYNGVIWNDATQNEVAYTNGNTFYQGGNLYTATADATINTTSPTSALSSTRIGTTTIVANTLKVGQKFTIAGAGYYSTPLGNVSTVTITTSTASSTATTISTVTTGSLPASATNLPFDFMLTCTVRSIGSFATAVCDGSFNYATALSAVAKTSNSLSTIGTIKFDSTVNEALDVKASWSAVTTQTATVQESRIDFI